MANTSPLQQTRDPRVKTPVVVVLFDSNAAPPSQSSNVIPYISPLLSRLGEANQRRVSPHFAALAPELSLTPIPPANLSGNGQVQPRPMPEPIDHLHHSCLRAL